MVRNGSRLNVNVAVKTFFLEIKINILQHFYKNLIYKQSRLRNKDDFAVSVSVNCSFKNIVKILLKKEVRAAKIFVRNNLTVRQITK